MYILPQAPFLPNNNNNKHMKNMNISTHHEQIYLNGHIFSASSAFLANTYSKNHEQYENIQKYMKNHIKNVVYSVPQAPFWPTNVKEIMKNMKISKNT